jgi:hypothetical protein
VGGSKNRVISIAVTLKQRENRCSITNIYGSSALSPERFQPISFPLLFSSFICRVFNISAVKT